MSIQSEIDRIKAAKADAKAALIERGVDPGDATIDEYGDQIRAIPTGVTSFNGRTGAVEPHAGDYTAQMVGARPDTWTPTADEVGAVPTTRTVNGQALSSNVVLDAGDVGARADDWMPTAAQVGAIPAVSGAQGQLLGFTSADVVGAVDAPSGGSGKRACRFVVGTSTAGWTADDCDYLCDGTDDQVEINAAIQALPSGGGEIVILDGTYNITATIAMNKDNVKLSGNGNATVLRRMWNSSAGEGVITITAVSGGCCVENIFVDGNKSAYNSSDNTGINLTSSNNNTITGNTCIRGEGTSSDYTRSQHTIYLYGTGNNYNLISSNNIMGKNYVSDGGTGNTFVNNKYN